MFITLIIRQAIILEQKNKILMSDFVSDYHITDRCNDNQTIFPIKG